MHLPALSSDDPRVVVAVMVLGSAVALLIGVGLATLVWGRAQPPPRRGRSTRGPRPAVPAQRVRAATDPAALRREAQRLTGYAVEAAQRAAEARAAAIAARERSTAAETIRDDAWHTYSTSESPLLVPSGAQPPGPVLGEEVTHAAFVAYREGAITVRELQQVWSGAEGVDPAEQERRRTADELAGRQRDARREYDRASSTARLAAEQARIAEVAAAALAAEALEAEREAQDAQAKADRYLPRAGRSKSHPKRKAA